MTLLDRLRGKRDILVPYFDYCRVLRGNRESVILGDTCRLRHDVYCVERALLPQEGGALETDEADSCAVHVGAYDSHGQLAASVRLVQPGPGQDYPFSQYCAPFPDVTLPPREQAGELSRLVVHQHYRRRRGDSVEGVPHGFAAHGHTRAIRPAVGGRRSGSPLLLLGLYRELYRHSREHGLRYWYAAMERPLARALDRMGLPFRPISGPAEDVGPVVLHMLELDALEARLRRENRFLAAWFHGEPVAWWVRLRLLLEAARLGRARDDTDPRDGP
ncbi:PEP-CTERM/exosortase system-associated acyltransferase [Massilia sp. PAMC28688]|uniref:PEP-CTERM/exosortase system-associated acyltransferase n=1 Tax=Massilia sp. PAMC28688 TaxID=2861283 RepID=UPI001E365927|nr:PEP-CTERM/exosortase system-associated acyltransferase [Massilia sp. PAMC28688]